MPRAKTKKRPYRPRKPPLDGTVRVTLSLDSQVVADLVEMSGRLGITRSAFVSASLAEMFGPMKRAIGNSPVDPDPTELRRLRGRSRDEIRGLISELGRHVDSLGGSSHE